VLWSTLSIPVRTLILTSLSIAFVVGWYKWQKAAVLIIVAALIVLSLLVQWIGVSLIKKRPALALQIMETRAFTIAFLSAALGAVATVVGVELAAPEDALEPNKTLITAGVAALTAFVSSVAITAESMDAAVGDYVMEKFREAFTTKNEQGKLTTTLGKGSDAEIALFTSYASDWTDWARANRKARVAVIAAAVAAQPGKSISS